MPTFERATLRFEAIRNQSRRLHCISLLLPDTKLVEQDCREPEAILACITRPVLAAALYTTKDGAWCSDQGLKYVPIGSYGSWLG